jgi:multidrug efflux system membrane fusion protein
MIKRVVAAGAMAAAALGSCTSPSRTAGAPLPPNTARVTRQTMVDTDEVAGSLGYGTPAALPGRIAGVVTAIPLAGDVIGRGRALYRVDNTPVVLMLGPIPAYRALHAGLTGPDVRELETNLRALGYRGFTVDDRFGGATAAAVRRWQHDRGLPRTGTIELGRVLFTPGAVRVDSVTTGVNRSTGGGEEVLRYTGTGHQVTARLDVSQQRLARVGAAVRVTLPDGRSTAGRVSRAFSVVSPDPHPQTQIEAVVALADPAVARDVSAAVVTVVFTAGRRANVLTVPVAALVVLAGGGYAVEVVDGSSTSYRPVRTGLFAGGRVEITGDGLTEGLTVGMPR